MDNKIKRNILIGGAWPYANNSLHLGHIAGLISGDVIARYYRQLGDNVIYVSGTDCHGTPITLRAKKENKTPKEIFQSGISSIPEDRQKHGLVLDFSIEDNMILQHFNEAPFAKNGFL